jgi:uncharacterized LabA/DUF88 family protein
MDIELAVNAMELADHVDHIVLFSGDGDFRSLVEAVQRRGVRVTVVSHDFEPASDNCRRNAPYVRLVHRSNRFAVYNRPQSARSRRPPQRRSALSALR